MNSRLNSLISDMIEYDRGDPMRIHHFIKVYEYASFIASEEGLSEEEQLVTSAAAIVHDIGIHMAEKKYGSSAGPYQEKEGPSEAEPLLKKNGFTDEQRQRIEYLIAHHHTYTNMDGSDYQILVEADFLVNIFEDDMKDFSKMHSVAENVEKKIFKTATGIKLLKAMYGKEYRKED